MEKGFDPVDIDDDKWDGQYVTPDIRGTSLVFLGKYMGREIFVEMAMGETLAKKKMLVELFIEKLGSKKDAKERKLTVKVKQDEDGGSDLMHEVLHEADFGTFYAWHRRINLGKLNGDKGQEYLESVESSERLALKIPVFIYEHSGISLSTLPFSCRWDSGQVGWWIFTVEDIAKIYGEDSYDNRKKAAECVKSQIEYMNDLNSGNVWGYVVEDEDGDVEDSCWGFVGDDAIEDMREHIPEELHQSLQEAWENRFE